MIQRHPLSDIFRVGYGRVLELKWRAQRWLDRSWFAGQGLSLTFWGEDWLGVLGGLLVKKPIFFDDYVSGRSYRDFSTLDELRQTAAALDAVIACDRLFSRLTIPPELLSARRFLIYKNLILTLWALDRVGCIEKNRFLSRAEFKLFFEQLWQSDDRPRRVSQVMKQSFLAWLCGLTGMRSHEITDKLGLVLESLFLEIEEEYGQVDTADLDPRFIHLFLIEG
jgi:integrase